MQTGSTSENPGGIQVGERTELAREANPDLCIQIHFNAGGGTGVEAIYKEAEKIEGLPRHTSIHAAGVIISDHDLTDYTAIMEGPTGIYVSQYEAEDLHNRFVGHHVLPDRTFPRRGLKNKPSRRWFV